MPPDGSDDTVILPSTLRRRAGLPAAMSLPPASLPPTGRPPVRGGSPWLLGLLAVGVMAAGGLIGILFLRQGEPDAGLAVPAAPPVVAAAPAPAAQPAPPPFVLPQATEAQILANLGPSLAVVRFAGNPNVVVLDFPTLGEQARMLNRVAALIEKAGLPRDRVLDDAELDAAARAGGGTAETFYYGHNYRASDLVRFFALADAAGVRLNADEERLRALAGALGWLRGAEDGALVSIPHAGTEPWLDMAARATMLRHELSHGEFFTRPDYAALVWRFWREMLTEEERGRFRVALGGAGYDPALEEVMANEAQAFLFHTADQRFFSAAALGLAAERVGALRAALLAAMPEGWLRDAMSR